MRSGVRGGASRSIRMLLLSSCTGMVMMERDRSEHIRAAYFRKSCIWNEESAGGEIRRRGILLLRSLIAYVFCLNNCDAISSEGTIWQRLSRQLGSSELKSLL